MSNQPIASSIFDAHDLSALSLIPAQIANYPFRIFIDNEQTHDLQALAKLGFFSPRSDYPVAELYSLLS
jgi:hypothetical protein